MSEENLKNRTEALKFNLIRFVQTVLKKVVLNAILMIFFQSYVRIICPR